MSTEPGLLLLAGCAGAAAAAAGQQWWVGVPAWRQAVNHEAVTPRLRQAHTADPKGQVARSASIRVHPAPQLLPSKSPADVREMLFQVFSALDRAQRKLGFNHADLGMR